MVSFEEWPRRRDRDQDGSSSSSSHRRRSYSRVGGARKSGSLHDEQRSLRRRYDHEPEYFDRRKGYDQKHQADSFSGLRTDFPKGFRSERDRPRREGGGSWSWWRSSKDLAGDGMHESPSIYSDSADRRSLAASHDEQKGKMRSRGSSSGDLSRNQQAKSAKVSKRRSVQVLCSSNEMEEGELEPDPEHEAEQPCLNTKIAALVDSDSCEVNHVQSDVVEELDENRGDGEGTAKDDTVMENEMCSAKHVACDEDLVHNHQEQAAEEEDVPSTTSIHHVEEENAKKEGNCHENVAGVLQKQETECCNYIFQDQILIKNMEEAQCNTSTLGIDVITGKAETKMVDEIGNELDMEMEGRQSPKHETGDEGIEAEADELWKHMRDRELKGLQKEQDCFELETDPSGSLSLPDHDKRTASHTNDNLVTLMLIEDRKHLEKYRDKGESLAICQSTKGDLLENAESQEGPGGKGKVASHAHGKELKIEPLDLSLALPGSLSNHSLKYAKPKPEKSSCGESINPLPSSLTTRSDGFGTFVSFASSQSFVHDPSCSLTHNSSKVEDHLIGSCFTFASVDLVCQAHTSKNSMKNGSDPPFQSVLLNGNSSQTSLPLIYDQHGFKPQSLFQQSTLRRQISTTDSHGSHDPGSQHTKDIRLLAGERSCATEPWNGEQFMLNGLSVTEKIIHNIVVQPLHLNSKMLQEMTDHSLIYLKDTICEMLTNKDKSSLLHEFQEALRMRSDMTMDALCKCPQVLLEILVAIKTGLPDFIQRTKVLSSSNLVGIFLNLKCRNLYCMSSLPVDNCDCKVCTEEVGFCSTCMCLVCSKFDHALNTCSWIGCDMCLHWCHTDCGLRGSHIINGHVPLGEEGFTETQFHCFACGHLSEMFGFVKEVFTTCAKDWKAETLTKELQHVRRIFSASNDARGRGLHYLADQMLLNLERNVDHSEVINQILAFLLGKLFCINNFSFSILCARISCVLQSPFKVPYNVLVKV